MSPVHSDGHWSDGPIPEDTISSLRHRLTTMRQIFGDSDDEDAVSKRKKQAFNKINRRNKNCMDNILDGTLMGLVLAVCLCMVLGAAFFAYKNLYFAVLKKMYPESYT